MVLILIKGQPLTLPDGVAFKLGGNEIKSVIIQGNLLRGIDNKTVKVQLF